LKYDETTFRRNDEILLQSWRDTRVVNMISTIHTLNMVDIPRRIEIAKKKTLCISQYDLFMKSVHRADQFSSEENCKVAKESCTVPYKLYFSMHL
jgi:hypothetical protein